MKISTRDTSLLGFFVFFVYRAVSFLGNSQIETIQKKNTTQKGRCPFITNPQTEQTRNRAIKHAYIFCFFYVFIH